MNLLEYYELLDKQGKIEDHKIFLKKEWLEFLAKNSFFTLQKINDVAQTKEKKGESSPSKIKDKVWFLSFEIKNGLSVYEINQKQETVKKVQPKIYRLARELLVEKELDTANAGDVVTEIILNPERWSELSDEQAEVASEIYSEGLISENDNFWLVTAMMKRLCKSWSSLDTQNLSEEFFLEILRYGKKEQLSSWEKETISEEGDSNLSHETEGKSSSQLITANVS